MSDRRADSNAPPEIPVTLSLPIEQVVALAEQHLEAGRLPAAEALCRDILRARADCAPALHLLGIITYQAGNLALALDFVRRATLADGSVALYHCNLGEMCRLAGDGEAALAAGRRALAIDPDMPQALNNVGIVHYERGEFDDAVAHYRRALARAQNYAEAHSNLGNALRAQKKYDEALIAYRQARQLRPDYAEAINNMGTALRDVGRRAEAEATYRHALALKPNDPGVLNNLALALKDTEQFDEAIELLTCSQAADPNNIRTLTYLALVRLEQKRVPDAEIAAQRALSLAGDDAEALNAMGLVRFEQQNADQALALFRRAVALKPDLADALNNIGNVLKESGQLPAARDAFERARINYDEIRMLGIFDRIRATIDRGLLDSASDRGYSSPLPVFVVGMPRSGTTLIEQILASHPEVYGAGELTDFNRLVDGMRDAGGKAFRYPEDTPALSADQLRELGEACAEGLRARAPGARRVTDKMPANFLFLGLIHLALPGARIIHVMRDPRDTCLSCYSKLFTAEQDFTYDLGELGRYYRKYAELMTHWRDVLPAGRVLHVRYEDVIADLEASARRIVEHCGLDWHPACIAFHESRRPVRTASASQVRRPIY